MRRLHAILVASDIAPTELLLSLYTVIWGLGLIFPPDQFSNSLVYNGMKAVMSETEWGGLFCVVGFLSLFTGLRGPVPCRQISTALSAVLWFVVIGFMVQSGVWPLGLFHFSLAEFAFIWIYWRLASPSRVVNE